MQTGKDKATLKSHTTCICCLKFNDRMIVSGSFKAIKLWDTNTYKPITYGSSPLSSASRRVVSALTIRPSGSCKATRAG